MAYLIAIDGTDASGKATQTALLSERLRNEGYNVTEISYPDYECLSSGPVRMYLDGSLGKNAGDTDAYAASVLFAVDRFASFRANWKREYERGKGSGASYKEFTGPFLVRFLQILIVNIIYNYECSIWKRMEVSRYI